MKRIFLIPGIVSLLFVALLCGCKQKPPTEERILSDISPDLSECFINDPSGGAYQEMVVEELNIEKRQTDDRNDTVWCAIDLENEYYAVCEYLVCYYQYYDTGGWILESVYPYLDTEYQIKTIPFEEDDIIPFLPQTIYGGDSYETNVESIDFNVPYDNAVYVEYEITARTRTRVNYQKNSYTLYFDGSEWVGDVENLESYSNWDVIGEWVLEEGDKDNFSFSLSIENFDQDTMTATGVSDFYCVDGYFALQEIKDVTSLVDAEIREINGKLVIDCPRWPYVEIDFYTNGNADVILSSLGRGAHEIIRLSDQVSERSGQNALMDPSEGSSDAADIPDENSMIEDEEAYTVTITGNGVRIRTRPSTDSDIIGAVNSGDVLTITGMNSDWYQVIYNGQTAYVSATYARRN